MLFRSQRSTKVKHEPDTRQEPIRNRKRGTCTGHGRVRKWGADWVPSMVVQPTGVAYSFLMECPIPSTKSETRHRKNRAKQRPGRDEQKEKKRNTHSKEIHIRCQMGNGNTTSLLQIRPLSLPECLAVLVIEVIC